MPSPPLRRPSASAESDGHEWPWLTDRQVAVVLVLLAGALTAAYLAIGPGLLMDDWWSLRNVRFEGAGAAAGASQWQARPATGVIYTLLFGLVGPHPAVAVVILGGLQAASAVLFHRVLRAYVTPLVATAAAVVWLMHPNHTSLEVWMSTTNIAVAQVLMLSGAVLLARRRLGWITGATAGICFAVATLAYEASAPISIAMALILPVLRGRRPLPLTTMVAAVPPFLAGLWAWIHVNPAKRVSHELVDLSPVLPANLGWGVAGFIPGVELVYAAGLAIVLISAARLMVPRWRVTADDAERTAIAGLAVMGLGALPFIRYAFEPLGGGDRENFIAAFGGAMVWAAGLGMMARRSRPATLAAAACLFLLMIPVRWHRWQLWHTAGQDAVAMTDAAADRVHHGSRRVMIGPGPVIVENTTAFDGQMNLEAGVQFAADDRDVTVVLVDSDQELNSAPPADRVDLRQVGHLGADQR